MDTRRSITGRAAFGEREKTLLDIAARLLDAPDLQPGDGFFDAGGDASLALRLLLDSSSTGLHLSMDQVREAATIADLAHAAVPVDESGGAWPTSGPIGLGLTTSWYLHASSERVRYWNINTVVETARPVDAGALEVAVRAVAAQHEATRHRFYRAAERWHAEVVDEARVEVRREFVGPLSPHEQELAVGRLMNDLQRSIDITNGPIAIVAIVDRGPGSTPVVALTASHLVSDGYSQSVLLEDLEIAYEQVLRGDEVSLPARPTSLRRWTERLQELAEDAETDRERAYWLSEERWQAAPVPLDHPGGGNRHGSATWLRVPMDRARTTALYASSRRRTAGVLTAFLAALGTAYAAWTGHDRMMYWLLLHGREQELHGLDLRRTVGCMLHSFPMLQRLPAGDRRAKIGAVRAMRSGLPRNGIGYDLLRYLRDDPDLPRMPQPEIVVNYRGRLAAAGAGLLAGRMPEHSRVRSDPDAPRLIVLELDAVVERGELVMRWGFNPELHEAASVERLAEAQLTELAGYA